MATNTFDFVRQRIALEDALRRPIDRPPPAP